MAKKEQRPQMGFKQAFTYVLDLLCYAYYTKADNLVSDFTFDELEKLYCLIFNKNEAPNRGNENRWPYSQGVQFLYEEIKRKREEKNKKVVEEE